MKTVKFTQTVERRRHGAEQVFEEGQKYSLADDLADHYLRRGLAVEATGKAADAVNPAPTPKASSSEKSDGNTVGGSANVGGKDGGDSGKRTEPAAKPAGAGSVAKKAVKKAAKSR